MLPHKLTKLVLFLLFKQLLKTFLSGKKTYRPVTNRSIVTNADFVTLNAVHYNHFVTLSLRSIIMKICVM